MEHIVLRELLTLELMSLIGKKAKPHRVMACPELRDLVTWYFPDARKAKNRLVLGGVIIEQLCLAAADLPSPKNKAVEILLVLDIDHDANATVRRWQVIDLLAWPVSAEVLRRYSQAYHKWQEPTYPRIVFIVPDDLRRRFVESIAKRQEMPGLFEILLMSEAVERLTE